MSRESSVHRHINRNASKQLQSEANENEFRNTSLNSIQFPPPRTPLNTISDPAQYQIESRDLESLDGNIEAMDIRNLLISKGIGIAGSNYGIPRVSGPRVKSYSEPNSVQNSPAKSFSKNLSMGVTGACINSRPPYYVGGGKGVSSSRVSRPLSMVMSEPKVDLPYFDLNEDNSFWNDHNVQVLVRLRPMNTMERVTHGYARCVRQESSQTILWLGHPETRFTFDNVACETISQERLFRVAGLPMVENCMAGYNSCIFAYGQTGSGKTYTMMGEIYEMEEKLNEDCGITPRIFEYLFTRISDEEENRKDEKLKYRCKCSFLEIYNEQITDLLEPSSTNLQLREDLKKGVYVENLTEHNVTTVTDVIKLLLEGAANRKIAATHMNRESSRSHCVFTCIIESRWEKESMSHFRFARLNLVDLAGSERQKSSGAEGDRLKEAANINKSLSTLGLVIMSLVDLAHGKQRHVPYRDSRLTFLLQDSLGGNSKTMIVANISPSISSVNETLSTLKFAQRAKLIQNNAKVNEDASGDVLALQRQIQQLKSQMSYLLKHHNLSKSFSCHNGCPEDSTLFDSLEEFDPSKERSMVDYHKTQNMKVESMSVHRKYGDEITYGEANDVQKADNDQKIDENSNKQLFETQKELREANLLIEAMEAEQLHLIEEVQLLQAENHRYMDQTSNMRKQLVENKLVKRHYHEGQTENLCNRRQVEQDYEHVEMETTKTILHLQEEIDNVTEENKRLNKIVADNDKEIRAISLDWENATAELIKFLLEGSRSLNNASFHIKEIACSFPQINVQISEQVEKAAKQCIEKEETILLLQNSLEEAQIKLKEMELNLSSLKIATMTFEQAHKLENEETDSQVHLARKEISESLNPIDSLYWEPSQSSRLETEACASTKEPSCTRWIKEAEIRCRDIWEFATDVNVESVNNFVIKIEESHAIIKEADFILNALLKVNENAKQSSLMWRKRSEELMLEKMSLIEEMDKLNSTICSKEKESETVQDEYRCTFLQVNHSLSLLEDSFSQMNKDVEEWISDTYNEVVSMTRDILHSIKNIKDAYLYQRDRGVTIDDLILENKSLKNELEKKEILSEGLHIDITLLQESASNTKDIKDEIEKLVLDLNQVRNELKIKTDQFDALIIKYSEMETAVTVSNSELDQARETIDLLSEQNAELRMGLKDLYLNKSEVEEQLDEQKQIVKCLENEILGLNSPLKKNVLSAFEDIEDELSSVIIERDQLQQEICRLTNKLELAQALADENEAIAVEARQEAESSKVYAEQKEEEVRILEHSVEELESTINVLEHNVYEVDQELERQQLIRDSLELKLQALRHRMQTVENLTESVESGNICVEQTHEQLSRELQISRVRLQEAHDYIQVVEEHKAELDREVKQLKEYISEVTLHADAQSSQYHQKYNALEAMVREVKTDSINPTSTELKPDGIEKISTRTRGSRPSSPFRCITGLVQQKNLEKDQELSMAKLRVEELEELAASRQKEICMLKSRLAATENMVHDVIRDLLGVKLDMTNYANLIDRGQIHKLVKDAQQQSEESTVKEEEILNLRHQISKLMEEKETYISELNRREEYIVDAQMAVEQLQERDEFLATQNELLKIDKKNLKRKVAEMDEMIKRLLGTQRTQKTTKPKEEKPILRQGTGNINKRRMSLETMVSGVNDELAQYYVNNGGGGSMVQTRDTEYKSHKEAYYHFNS